MKEIVFTTTNKAKIEEIEKALSKYGISVIHVNFEIEEPYGHGLQAIAKAKAVNAFQKTGKPSAGLDTGFFIKALNGYPGDYIGEALDKGLDWILKSVEGKDRSCTYVNCLAYIDESLAEPIIFESELEGSLSLSPKGKIDPPWCILHRIFIPLGVDKTLAEIAQSEDEYKAWREERFPNSTSYKFASWLSKHLS